MIFKLRPWKLDDIESLVKHANNPKIADNLTDLFPSYSAKRLINYQSEKSFAFKLRKKRAHRIKSLINNCFNEHNKVNIIDVGGTKTYWKIIPNEFLSKNNVHITVINLPSPDPLPENDEIFTFVGGDGCNLTDFSDNSFHIYHSNSVIEHVGNWDKMVSFSKEAVRVANKYYLQTPNFWFPIEPHFLTPFFHWLPKSIRIKLVMNFKLGWFRKAKNYNEAKGFVENCNLLTKKDLLKLFPNASVHNERIFLFIKSFVLIGK